MPYVRKQTPGFTVLSQLEEKRPAQYNFDVFQVNTTFIPTARFQLYFCFIKQTLKHFSTSSRCMSHLEMLSMKKLLLSLKRLRLSKRSNQRKITSLKL